MSRYNERGERLGTFAIYRYDAKGRPLANPPIYPTREEADRQVRLLEERHPDAPRSRKPGTFGQQFHIVDKLSGSRMRHPKWCMC